MSLKKLEDSGRKAGIPALALWLCTTLTGCLMIGGSYGNDDLRDPHRFCLAAGTGKLLETSGDVSKWLTPPLPA